MIEKDTRNLCRRIQELENKVEQLRIGRRILMRLIEKSESEKRKTINHLQGELEQLRMRNQRFAHMIWQKNKELVLLTGKNQRCVVPYKSINNG